VKNIIERFGNGEVVIVFDDLYRENEADLIVAIDKLTPEKVTFLITHGRGILCAALNDEIVAKKGLPLAPSNKGDKHSTAFTLSVDSIKTKTGVSPIERCITAKELINPATTLKDFVTPGHLYPLRARGGHLLERRGHTEAAVSLCKWANLNEAALICEMIKDDGNMLSIDETKEFANRYNIPFCTVEELVEYQKLNYTNVSKLAESKLTTKYGEFDIKIYKELYTNKEHIFLSMGDYTNGLVRVHSECATGDIFHSVMCDCGYQLEKSLEIIANNGAGAIIYLKQEGRGIGLAEKIKAYNLQQQEKIDTVEANIRLGHFEDERDFHQAAWILKEQGFKTVRLLTNNPIKLKYLEKHGFTVKREKLPLNITDKNREYLKTKKEKMGHIIEDV